MVKKFSTDLYFDEPSLTHQSFKDECDINRIMSRYVSSGVLDHVKYLDDSNLHYGDFSGTFSYQEAANRVAEIETMFELLPSNLRSRFANDPSRFINFATDPQNSEEMVQLGLLPPDSKESTTEPSPNSPTSQSEKIDDESGMSKSSVKEKDIPSS